MLWVREVLQEQVQGEGDDEGGGGEEAEGVEERGENGE